MLSTLTLRPVLLKSCPRCHGDLILDRDVETEPSEEEAEYVCLQCGRRAIVALRGGAKVAAAARAA